ncbi:MAG: dephospho-CoA kinase [Oscillospiraceae bacterium]
MVGLTGQSGAGKTAVSAVFAEAGYGVIDADKAARDVTAPGSACCKALAEFFPEAFDAGFALDRRRLGALVFGDRARLDLLNQTIYPFILAHIDALSDALVKAGKTLLLLDAPTLFEAGADASCDVIVSVLADENTRLTRVVARDGISEEQARKRFSSQKSAEFFRANSDYTIENNAGADALHTAALLLANKIKEQFDAIQPTP